MEEWKKGWGGRANDGQPRGGSARKRKNGGRALFDTLFLRTFSRRGLGMRDVRIFVGTLGLLMLAVGTTRPAVGQQHIIDRYLSAHFFSEAQSVLEAQGRSVPGLPPAWLPTAVDSLRPPPDTAATEEEGFQMAERRVIKRLERSWFQKEFGDTKWAFLGTSSYLTTLDTTFTRVLRARLEAQFGPPTLTLADLDREEAGDEYIQFEYWFVVNDSIPAKVMDVHGPYDRGLIVATERRFREDLPAFREALLAPMMRADERAPYADYFYDADVDIWYRTGYNGVEFFLEPVPRRRVVSGRRPRVEAVQAIQSSEPDSSSERSSP